MPHERQPISEPAVLAAVESAEACAGAAADLRSELRWSAPRGDHERESSISGMLDSIDEAMRPIRSYIGRLVWDPISTLAEERLRRASTRLQYERKQLKKMRKPE